MAKIVGLSPEEYKGRMEEACEFLEGKSKDLIAGLEEEMQKAAAHKWKCNLRQQ